MSLDGWIVKKRGLSDRGKEEGDGGAGEGEAKKAKVAAASDGGFLSRLLTEESWREALASEMRLPRFKSLEAAVEKAYLAGEVYPPAADIFAAFNSTPLSAVRVVILGQDPYHNSGQAHGLSFSVRRGVAVPPSLRRMYRELEEDPGVPHFRAPAHGHLQGWADQGVFLLNVGLTVEAHKANSHAKIGWELFTDAAIRALSRRREHVVYLLWGRFAQKKAQVVDRSKNLVLEHVHPSPLTGNKWFGNRHFSRANEYLKAHGYPEIDWAKLD